MRIHKIMMRALISRGLFDDQAEAVLKHYTESELGKDMKNRLDDDESDYPKHMLGIVWSGVLVSAVAWIKANMPKHWALSIFESELSAGNTVSTTESKAEPEVPKDTTLNNRLEDYLKFVKQEGFEELKRIPFDGSYNYKETFFIFFHRRDGILLTFDTYGGDHVNGGKFSYNWRPKPELMKEDDQGRRSFGQFVSSGQMFDLKKDSDEDSDWVWIGDHDCREDLCKNLRGLRENGEFVSPWVKQPFIYLLHYGDHKFDHDYEKINRERIKMLPEDIRKLLG